MDFPKFPIWNKSAPVNGPERNEFQKIADLTIENSTNTGQHINIKTCNFVVAIMIDLCPLHFCPVTQPVFTDAGFADQYIQFDTNRSVRFHCVHLCQTSCTWAGRNHYKTKISGVISSTSKSSQTAGDNRGVHGRTADNRIFRETAKKQMQTLDRCDRM